ncbi:helix-turn-helix domain-containing protein [Pedosphaera parvula]|uniref:helix-turn-helix domain-containing protein n=1 Tax=Pedosphaera parvula TaxID=1032527 RepID=UPI001ED8C1CB|nr:helix-turn-helix transcriptional regulator [Pedosphaera parvula]
MDEAGWSIDDESMPSHDPVLKAFGDAVRTKRVSKKLTQEKLAERATLDPTYVSGIERGLRNPGIKNVARIAKALGISISELCKGVDA